MSFFKDKQSLNKENKKGLPQDPRFSFLLSEIKSDANSGIGEELTFAGDMHRRLSKTVRMPESVIITPNFIEEFFNETGIAKKIKKMTAGINLRNRSELLAISRRIQSLIFRAPISKKLWRVLDRGVKDCSFQNKKMPLYCRLEMIGDLGGDINRLENRELAITKNQTEKIFKKIISLLYTAELMEDREQRGFLHIGFPVAVMLYAKLQGSSRFLVSSESTIGKNILSLKSEDPKNKTEYFLHKPNLIAGTSAVLNALPDQAAVPADILVVLRETALAEGRIKKSFTLGFNYSRAGNSIYGLEVIFLSPYSSGKPKKEEYILSVNRKPVIIGTPVGTQIAVGVARVLGSVLDERVFTNGDIIVAKKYNPEIGRRIKSASAFVLESDEIPSRFIREISMLGKPGVIGAKNATKTISSSSVITVSCAAAERAEVYSGALPYEVKSVPLPKKNKIPVQINGTQIISIESIIENDLFVHPLVLCNSRSSSDAIKKYETAIFTAVALAASSAFPESVVISLSNSRRSFFEYLGKGIAGERKLGLRLSARGAERYLNPAYQYVLSAECSAISAVHQNLNLKNIIIRLPYCRSPFELERMLESLSKNGISREKGFRFSLTTDFPGHGLLTQAFAAHVDELVFDMDELVSGIMGERINSVNQEIQNSVETVLNTIVRSAHRSKTSVAVSGSILARQPKILFSAVKSGVGAVVVTVPEQADKVRAGIVEAESTVGNTGYGTNSRWLGLVAGIAALGGLLISAGAGCGLSEAKKISPEVTPAQIRAQITAAIEENNRQWETVSKVTSVVNGFAHFQIQYPNAWVAEYKSDAFVLRNELSSSTLAFYIQLTPNNPQADTITNFSVNGFPARLFPASVQSASSSEYFYEITMPDNRILEISASPSDDEVKQIVESVVFR